VNLHLFAEGAEPVVLHLMDRSIPHRVGERRLRYEPNRLISYPVVHFVAGHREIDVVVFPLNGIRQSPASPVDGRPMRRAAIEEVESLLNEYQSVLTESN
jgi:hypothetical protein